MAGDPSNALNFPVTTYQITKLPNPRHASDQRRPTTIQHSVCEYVPDCAEHSDLFLPVDAGSAGGRGVRANLWRSAFASDGVSGGISAVYAAGHHSSLLHVD